MVEPAIRGRIGVLDGWRALSIACVVAAHLVNYHARGGDESHVVRYVSVFGVEVFFVISGFLITSLALDERRRTGRFAAGDFWGRRIFRILPAFFAYLGVLAALRQAGVIDPGSLAPAAAFACNVERASCGWFVSHSWSLAYEQQFYLLFPLLLLLPRRTGRAFGLVHAVIVGTLVIGAFAFPRVSSDLREYVFYFAYISAGALAAAHREQLARLATGGHGRACTALALATCATALVLLGSGRLSSHLDADRSRAVEAALVPLALAWLIWRSTTSNGPATRLLEWAPLRALGRLSYSLYIWQQLFTGAPAWTGYQPAFSPWVMVPVAIASYALIERPLMRLGNRWFGARRHAVPAVAGAA